MMIGRTIFPSRSSTTRKQMCEHLSEASGTATRRRNFRLSAPRLQTYCDAATSCGEGDTPAAT